MRTLLLAFIAVAGCGTDFVDPGGGDPGDVDPPVDAPAPTGAPAMVISSPRANEAFYTSQIAPVTWIATAADQGALTCDVIAIDPANRIPIANAVVAVSGELTSVLWPLASVPPSLGYRIEIRCRDASAQEATVASELFGVAGPPQPVSFSTQIVPLFARCDGGMCHDATLPVVGLDLTPTAAYTALLDVLSKQCTTTALVVAGAPHDSYLVHKLQGTGPCFMKGRMPKGEVPYTAVEIQLVRDWIANGAPNN